MRSIVILFWLACCLTAFEPVVVTKQSVTVTLTVTPGIADEGEIIGVFTPDPTYPKPLHLYGLTLPAGMPGIPTAILIPAGSPLVTRGPLRADQATQLVHELPIFPAGPVTLHLPMRWPAGDGAPRSAEVIITYLACTESSCLIPVRQTVTLMVPTVAGAAVPPSAPLTWNADEVRAIVRDELAQHREQDSAAHIAWLRPTTVAEAEALIAQAPGSVLLDFTGPSCLNCQIMEKTVFNTAAVRRALATLTAIQINTDPPNDELAGWQQRRFQSQERPLYVLIHKGVEQRWSTVFAPTDTANMASFLAFLDGGAGKAGGGDGNFWILALLGGLVTLLMPCTYPMIPFTLNFFAKQAANGHRMLPLALVYGAGIVICFVGLGVLITGVFGANLATLAGHPVTNVVIAAVFVLFGLSLLGVVFLRIPGMGGSRGGYLGALLMGLTFAATAFSCTAPFAGSVLASAVATGTWGAAVAGMGVYGLAIAVPFVLLALSPRLLVTLPKAGAWMNEIKVVGGLVELAAALKFLVIADYAWHWGVFGRTSTVVAWSALALVIAVYLLGMIRWEGDDRIEQVGPMRLIWALSFLGLGIWFAAGAAGLDLGAVEGLFPG